MTLISFSSCIDDGCKGVVCDNDGICVDGNCACAAGYEGINCELLWNRRFTGTWQVTDTIKGDNTGSRYQYEITITADTNASVFLINNFAGANFDGIACTRVSPLQFSITTTNVIGGIVDTITISNGSGMIDTINNIVRMSYDIINDSTVRHYSEWKR